MLKLLFVSACPRGQASRTLRLANAFLEEFTRCVPAEVVTQDLTRLNLPNMDEALLAVKESLCDRCAWEDSFFRHAVPFQRADAVVIAAPYWDLSFPSILKIWVENMYVRNLTFRYEHDRCIGLCRGREAVYLTTAGSPIGDNDWGAGYIRAVMHALGIQAFTSVRAEGLDLAGNDAEAIMAQAQERARLAARQVAAHLALPGKQTDPYDIGEKA